jgi:hypothetical protein
LVFNEFEIMLYQEIRNGILDHTTTQATETELVPLKKGQSIENTLFNVEDDPKNNQVRMKKHTCLFD